MQKECLGANNDRQARREGGGKGSNRHSPHARAVPSNFSAVDAPIYCRTKLRQLSAEYPLVAFADAAEATRALVQATVSCRRDYSNCNSLLADVAFGR